LQGVTITALDNNTLPRSLRGFFSLAGFIQNPPDASRTIRKVSTRIGARIFFRFPAKSSHSLSVILVLFIFPFGQQQTFRM